MKIIGKTFSNLPVLDAESILVNVYQCEICGSRQTWASPNNACMQCKKIKEAKELQELKDEKLNDEIRRDAKEDTLKSNGEGVN
jgi:hypothetical protein